MADFRQALARLPRRERKEVRDILAEANRLMLKSKGQGAAPDAAKQLNSQAAQLVWKALERISAGQPTP